MNNPRITVTMSNGLPGVILLDGDKIVGGWFDQSATDQAARWAAEVMKVTIPDAPVHFLHIDGAIAKEWWDSVKVLDDSTVAPSKPSLAE